jgi:hypothetical protein
MQAEAPASTAPSSAPPSNANLVNAYDYFAQSPTGAGSYYFTTPSGKWRCAIVPRSQAGCQATGSAHSGMAIPGAPDTVDDGQGATDRPNAIVVETAGDAHFAALDPAAFTLIPGPATALPFNKILAAAGFRCNVSDAGVSCLSEATGEGFTFSADGYTLQYTDLPAAPS